MIEQVRRRCRVVAQDAVVVAEVLARVGGLGLAGLDQAHELLAQCGGMACSIGC
jgi:hypothetical protein